MDENIATEIFRTFEEEEEDETSRADYVLVLQVPLPRNRTPETHPRDLRLDSRFPLAQGRWAKHWFGK